MDIKFKVKSVVIDDWLEVERSIDLLVIMLEERVDEDAMISTEVELAVVKVVSLFKKVLTLEDIERSE